MSAADFDIGLIHKSTLDAWTADDNSTSSNAQPLCCLKEYLWPDSF